MNKKILYIALLLSGKDTFSSQAVTTSLRPTSGNAFITMVNSNGSATQLSVTFGNKVYLGDGTNPITITANGNISYQIVWPTSGNVNILGINSNGELITTPVYQLGESGNNEITCYPEQDITIKTTNNGNIKFNANGSGNLNFIANNINTITLGSSYVLALDINNNLITTDKAEIYYIGEPEAGNYIALDNTGSTGITMNTTALGGPITLNAGTSSNIVLFSNNITTPSSNTFLLGINSSNEVITLNDSFPIFCGDLTATGSISLGNYSQINNTGNSIKVPQSGNILLESGTGNNIELNAAGTNSTIKLLGTGITAPASGNPYVALTLDNNNNIVTSNENYIYIFGNVTGSNKSFVKIDNELNTGITCNGVLFLKNGGYTLPANNNTASLTISSTGEVGILVSSKRYKENIHNLAIKRESFNKLQPCTYNYINSNKEEIGLIAEEVWEIKNGLENIVTIGEDGLPLTVNYNALAVVVADQLIQDREINTKNIEKIIEYMTELRDHIQRVEKKNSQLESQIKELKKTIKRASIH